MGKLVGILALAFCLPLYGQQILQPIIAGQKPAAPGGAAPTLVTGQKILCSSPTGTPACSLPANITTGNTVVVFLYCGNTGSGTLAASDATNGAYTSAATKDVNLAWALNGEPFIKTNATGGLKVVNGDCGGSVQADMEVSEVTASTKDVGVCEDASDAAVTTIASPFTTVASNVLALGGLYSANATTMTNSWTSWNNGGNYRYVRVANKTFATGGAQTLDATLASGYFISCVVGLKP